MKHKLRYVAISATLPNLQDISSWLNAARKYIIKDKMIKMLMKMVIW